MSGLPFPNLPEQFCIKCDGGECKMVNDWVVCLVCKHKRQVEL